jgi:hypothetical protein
MSDMLDVVHFFFETDNTYPSGEVAEGVSKMRTTLYREMYGQHYPYAVSASGARGQTGTIPDDFLMTPEEEAAASAPINPFSARKQPVKAFVPATNLDENSAKPFGRVLDAPMQ